VQSTGRQLVLDGKRVCGITAPALFMQKGRYFDMPGL
jgi:hypothetical protein